MKRFLIFLLFISSASAQTRIRHYAWQGRQWVSGASIDSSASYAFSSGTSYAFVFAFKNTDHTPTVVSNKPVTFPLWGGGFMYDGGTSPETGACTDYNESGGAFAKATETWATNKWYWVACKYDSSGLKIFVNGVLQATNATAMTPLGNSAQISALRSDAPTGTVLGKFVVWFGSSSNSLSLPSDADLKYLTNLATACSADPTQFAPESIKQYLPIRGLSPEPDAGGAGINGVVTGSPTLVTGPCEAGGKPRAVKPAGLLTQSSNGRYFQANGKALVLAGLHTWYDIETRSLRPYATARFTTEQYANYLQARGNNYTRLWMNYIQSAKANYSSTETFGILPFKRIGDSGCAADDGTNAADGGNKWDLNCYNEQFFDRLRETVQKLNARGIYASVMLWPGGSMDADTGTSANGWDNSPFKSGNNIQGYNCNPAANNSGLDMESTDGNANCLTAQDNLIKHLIDTLNDLDGYFYVISNEPAAADTDCDNWQRHLISMIRTYESGKQKQHPIMASPGITATGFHGGCQSLSSGTPLADAWACADTTPTNCFGTDHNNPPIAATNQVQFADTDHIEPNSPSIDHLWRWFMRGYNLALMDDPMNGTSSTDHQASETTSTDAMRYTLGDALSYSNRMPMQSAVPWDNTTAGVGKCATTYCLTDDSTVYAMYFPTGNAAGAKNLTVSASATTSTCEWYAITDRSVLACTYQGTGSHNYTAPNSGSCASGPCLLFVH